MCAFFFFFCAIAEMSAGKAKVYKLVTAGEFDSFIIGCIVANCIVMGGTYYNEPTWWETTQEVTDRVCLRNTTCRSLPHAQCCCRLLLVTHGRML